MRFLDRLNTPLAFVVVLVIFLAMNGFLLYHYQANLRAGDTPPSAPSEQRDLTTEAMVQKTTTSEGTTADSDRPEKPTLQRALQDCDGEERECVLRFVSETAPQAQYVDEKAGIEDSGRERNMLYFSDPSRSVCDFERFEGMANETAPVYVVIIAGEGSYDGQYAGCLPEF